MISINNVCGTQDKILPIELGVDTVYIRKNITRKTNEDGNEYWQYDEQQLTYQEYVKQILPQLDSAIAELTILIGEKDNV